MKWRLKMISELLTLCPIATFIKKDHQLEVNDAFKDLFHQHQEVVTSMIENLEYPGYQVYVKEHEDHLMGVILKHEELHYNELQQYIEHIPDIVFYKDQDLIYRSINKAGRLFYEKHGIHQLIGFKDHELALEEDFINACYENDLQCLHTLKAVDVIEKMVDATSGEVFYYHSKKAPIFHQDGTLKGIIGVVKDVSEHVKAQKKLEYYTYHDALTTLYNRNYFEGVLQKKGLHQYPYGIVSIDLNILKLVNDTFGHHYGDNYIKMVGHVIQQLTKDEIPIRLGGDEFLILFPYCNEERMSTFLELLNHRLRITIEDIFPMSYAYSIKRLQEGQSLKEVLIEADKEMYQKKLKDHKVLSLEIKQRLDTVLKQRYPEKMKDLPKLKEYIQRLRSLQLISANAEEKLQLFIQYRHIGKCVILNEEEQNEMLEAEKGYHIANRIFALQGIAYEILAQYEHHDGSGPLLGLKNEEIPFIVQIVRILDLLILHKEEDHLTILQQYTNTLLNPTMIEVVKQIL